MYIGKPFRVFLSAALTGAALGLSLAILQRKIGGLAVLPVAISFPFFYLAIGLFVDRCDIALRKMSRDPNWVRQQLLDDGSVNPSGSESNPNRR